MYAKYRIILLILNGEEIQLKIKIPGGGQDKTG